MSLLTLARQRLTLQRLGEYGHLLFKAQHHISLSFTTGPNQGPVITVEGCGGTIEAAIDNAVANLARRQAQIEKAVAAGLAGKKAGLDKNVAVNRG